MEIAVRAGEVMDLQPLDLLLDRLACRQQRRHRDQRAQMRGHAVAQSPSAGRSVAPKIRVTPRFTSATATSIAGIAPRRRAGSSHAPCSPAAASASSGTASRIAATTATAPT